MGAGAQGEAGKTEPASERERDWREAQGVPAPPTVKAERLRIEGLDRRSKVEQALGRGNGQPVQHPIAVGLPPPDPPPVDQALVEERAAALTAALRGEAPLPADLLDPPPAREEEMG